MASGFENALKSNQIIGHIVELIKNGTLPLNAQIPSIHQMAAEFHIANETVVKAYKKLKEKGIIKPVRGKGFFVATTNLSLNHSIFVLFDTFSAYKETLYKGMLQTFGKDVFLDMYFHHHHRRTFETLIRESNGRYTEYIILPYSKDEVIPILQQLPQDKLYLLDYQNRNYPCKGVYQDFENDIYHSLNTIPYVKLKYKRLYFIYKNKSSQIIADLYAGFSRYCSEYQIEYHINDGKSCPEVESGDGFVVIDDENLVELVLKAESKQYMLGRDVGIISYNDTSLKQIAAGGISVISTDFFRMGQQIATMILEANDEHIINPCHFINRGSF